MPHRHEIRSEWLLACHDLDGRTVNAGAAVTTTGRVLLVLPPPGIVLTTTETDGLLNRIRQAWFATFDAAH
ncbi:hypothetical protein [Saccharothrix xinjiangensis]|uniref:Uncharacterized protein n=1 Tax=Saccharothrix xinjiangensis TaxID=204798 RepID=A0ABV9XT51_9PSEU